MIIERRYRLGSTGPEVAEIRVRLTALGLLDDLTDGFHDPGTAVFDEAVDRAVRAFQQRRGIISDGVVGPITFRALEEARWRLGDRILHYSHNHPLAGDDVAGLQQRLLDLGFDSGRMDGIFGADTESALRDFQRNVGLPADGTAGPLTFKARPSSPVRSGGVHPRPCGTPSASTAPGRPCQARSWWSIPVTGEPTGAPRATVWRK